jgi:hypothetical protein
MAVHNVQQVIEHFAAKRQVLRVTDDGRIYAMPKGISSEEGEMLDQMQEELVEALRAPPFRASRTVYVPPTAGKKKQPKEQNNADQSQAGPDVQGDPDNRQGHA